MSNHEDPIDDDGDSAVKVAESRPKLKRPQMHKVMLINDDFTPMEFVVHVLEKFFNKDRHEATKIMLTVHTDGAGVCGLYTREVAETRVAQVNDYSQNNKHPLLCTSEVE